MDYYKSQLHMPGSKFVVKNRVYGVYESTIGFLSYFKCTPENNVIRFSSVITRKGKNGQHRLEPYEFFTPIFDFDCASFKNIVNLEKKYMVQLIWENSPISVNDMEPMDFAGWALTKANMLKILSVKGGEYINGGHVNLGAMGQLSSSIAWPPNDLALNTAYRLRSIFSNMIFGDFVNRVEDPEFKMETITAIRKAENRLTKRMTTYLYLLNRAKLSAALFLKGSKKSGLFNELDENLIENTINKSIKDIEEIGVVQVANANQDVIF